jgi:hypothetical protein
MILVSDWQIFFKSSPLKLLSQMNRNLVESNYGRSSKEIAHFIPITVTTQTEHVQDKKNINWAGKKYYNIKTSYVSILDYPHFICIMNNKGNKSNTRHRILDYIKNSDAVRSVDIDAHFDINQSVCLIKRCFFQYDNCQNACDK